MPTSARHVTLEQKVNRLRDGARADRRDTNLELRRGRRERQLQVKRKRRTLRGTDVTDVRSDGAATVTGIPTPTTATSPTNRTATGDIVGPAVVAEQSLVERVIEAAGVLRQFKAGRLDALAELAEMLAGDESSVAAFLRCDGALPALLRGLHQAPTQLGAVHCITNIAASVSEHTRAVLEAAPMLVTLLDSGNPHVLDMCANAVGNMAADGPECQERLYAHGAVFPLCSLIQHHAAQVVRSAAFALSQLLRGMHSDGRASVSVELIPAAVSALGTVGEGDGDREALGELMWLLTELLVDNPGGVELVLELEVLPPLLQMLVDEVGRGVQDPCHICAILRILGTLAAAGPPTVIRMIVESSDALASLQRMLLAPALSVRAEATWVVATVANGDAPEHAAALIEAGLVPHLVALMGNEPLVRVEAVMALLGIGHRGGAFTTAVVSANVLPALLPLLVTPDVNLQLRTLQLVEVVCRLHPDGSTLIEGCKGVDCLEAQQFHADTRVQEAVSFLLNQYFGVNGPGGDQGDEADEACQSHTVAKFDF